MSTLTAGAEIGIPCDVKQGPFEDEKLVSFDTMDGPVTGFVSANELKQIEDRWVIRAVVMSQEGDVVTVRVHGSFFTTNGLATIRREMAMAA